MVTVYTWGTPNGFKPLILLEELEVDYRIAGVDIGADEQFTPAFLALNPNNKIPVLVDDEVPVTLFESAAILQYLGEKFGRFLPIDTAGRFHTLQWVAFQVAGIGPMLGQASHFRKNGRGMTYALDRFLGEAARLFGVLEQQLGANEYLAGSTYTIADMSMWPWMRKADEIELRWEDYPHVRAWRERIGERPAVQRAMAIDFQRV